MCERLQGDSLSGVTGIRLRIDQFFPTILFMAIIMPGGTYGPVACFCLAGIAHRTIQHADIRRWMVVGDSQGMTYFMNGGANQGFLIYPLCFVWFEIIF